MKIKELFPKLPGLGISKRWLHFTAGLLWFAAGMMLIGFASRWLKLVDVTTMLLLIFMGFLLAAGIYLFGFSKLAKKNIRRINMFEKEKICVFAFQSWTSYPLVVFMISLGIYLRVYSSIPKSLLAIMYLGIGGALFSASMHYFTHFARSTAQ